MKTYDLILKKMSSWSVGTTDYYFRDRPGNSKSDASSVIISIVCNYLFINHIVGPFNSFIGEYNYKCGLHYWSNILTKLDDDEKRATRNQILLE